jgi:hypothetical protein
VGYGSPSPGGGPKLAGLAAKRKKKTRKPFGSPADLKPEPESAAEDADPEEETEPADPPMGSKALAGPPKPMVKKKRRPPFPPR